MPTVGLERDLLFARIGRSYTEEEFELLCFEFGVELDDVTSEAKTARDMGVDEKTIKQRGLSDATVYAIDVPANRYDLLCIEGMARSLRTFLGLEKPPVYALVEPAARLTMVVDSATTDTIRPFVACAVLRGMDFTDPVVYKSFIELQEKLHQNICRRRTLVAIGTHDLATVTGPFRYAAEAPELIEFAPLTDSSKCYKAKPLLDHYRTSAESKHLKPYTNIIYDSPLYPVIRDAENRVLSMPPIINGAHSRIQAHTTDVLIECTGTDETKANVVCDTVVTMFSQYCGFRIEPVTVEYRAGASVTRVETTPKLSTRLCSAPMATVRGTIGLTLEELSCDQAVKLCEKMQLTPASYCAETDVITVTVPPTRSDIYHSVDVIEDIAIAYGYNNVPERLPKTLTVGCGTRENGFSDLLRDEVSRAGYVECLTHGLCRMDENFDKLRHGPEIVGSDAYHQLTQQAVTLSNPASEDFEIVRTTLLVGALKTLQHNKRHAIRGGMKLFELSEVVLRDAQADVGARNERRLVATYTGATAGFEVIHGLLDRVMQCAMIPPAAAYAADSLKGSESVPTASTARGGLEYTIVPDPDSTYFPGRGAQVVLQMPDGSQRQVVGKFGVLHPEVLAHFEIDFPTSSLEINVDKLCPPAPL